MRYLICLVYESLKTVAFRTELRGSWTCWHQKVPRKLQRRDWLITQFLGYKPSSSQSASRLERNFVLSFILAVLNARNETFANKIAFSHWLFIILMLCSVGAVEDGESDFLLVRYKNGAYSSERFAGCWYWTIGNMLLGLYARENTWTVRMSNSGRPENVQEWHRHLLFRSGSRSST